MEGGTPIGLAFAPDAALVTMQDALTQGQPNPGAFKLILAMQPLEHPEQLVGVGHVEAGAVVLDAVDRFAPYRLPRHRDVGYGAIARELDRIADQVDPHLPQHGGIAFGLRQLAAAEFDLALRLGGQQVRGHPPGQGLHVHRLDLQLPAPQAREAQQIVDQLAHALGVVAHHLQQPPALVIELVAVGLEQLVAEAIHGPQRGAQIV